eukprot:544360-Prorocentrum_minimum.AAC.1
MSRCVDTHLSPILRSARQLLALRTEFRGISRGERNVVFRSGARFVCGRTLHSRHSPDGQAGGSGKGPLAEIL